MGICVQLLLDNAEPEELLRNRIFSVAISHLEESDHINLVAVAEDSAERGAQLIRDYLVELNSAFHPTITLVDRFNLRQTIRRIAEACQGDAVCFSCPQEIVYHSTYVRLVSVIRRMQREVALGAFRVALVSNSGVDDYVSGKESFSVAQYDDTERIRAVFPLSAGAISRRELLARSQDSWSKEGNLAEALKDILLSVRPRGLELSNVPCADLLAKSF